jgi:hypothetical protein
MPDEYKKTKEGEKVGYKCKRCIKTLFGMNPSRLKQHLLCRNSGCNFLDSKAAQRTRREGSCGQGQGSAREHQPGPSVPIWRVQGGIFQGKGV